MEFYSVAFTLPKKPELEFEIRPVTSENYTEAAKSFAETYATSNPLLLYFGISAQQYFDGVSLSLAKECAENNLGIIVYCKTNNEIACAVFHEDLKQSKRPIEYKDPKTDNIKGIRWVHYLRNQNLDLFKNLANSPDKCFRQRGFSTNKKYLNLGLATILSEFCLFKHPILKDARYFIGEDINPAMSRVHVKVGFEIVWEIAWEDFKDVEGCEYYAELNEFLEKNGYEKADKLRLAVFDREKHHANTK